MVAEDVSSKMAEQLDLVLERARELFVDRLEKRAREKAIDVCSPSESDKRSIERLFSELVYAHVIAEAAAIISYLTYTELRDDSILARIVPDFINQCQDRSGQAPESLATKTRGLVDLSKDVANTAAGSEVAALLLKDIASVAEARPMRAIFDGVVLSLLGE